MKSKNELLVWAAKFQYPQLVISEGDVIRHGELSWRRFLKTPDKKRLVLAWERINRWNSLIEKKAVRA